MMTLNESSDAKLKIVVDTSVYIAAVLRPGLCEDVLRKISQGVGTLYCSEDIFRELETKMTETELGTDKIRAKEVLLYVKTNATFVKTKPLDEPKLRDREDTHILACALAAQANLIVTLDKDILSLKTYGQTGIIHPKTFTYTITRNET